VEAAPVLEGLKVVEDSFPDELFGLEDAVLWEALSSWSPRTTTRSTRCPGSYQSGSCFGLARMSRKVCRTRGCRIAATSPVRMVRNVPASLQRKREVLRGFFRDPNLSYI